MDPLSDIRSDLRRLKRRRGSALLTYSAALTVFLAALVLGPTRPGVLVRDGTWILAFALMLSAVLMGAAVTVGAPLVGRRWVYGVGALMALGTLAALAVTMVPAAPGPEDHLVAGLPCFLFGTTTSGLAMLGLGAISGRLWRRFPNPRFVLALGMTGVGLAGLHVRCGGVHPVHLVAFHLGPLAVLYVVAHLLVRAREGLARDA